MKALTEALVERERKYRVALDCLRDPASEAAVDGAYYELREALELIHCLRRLIDGRTRDEIHRAFGAPGDFGYETVIGRALFAVYRGKSGECVVRASEET